MSSPNTNPYGVSQIYPVVNAATRSTELSILREEQDVMLVLRRFYTPLSILESTHMVRADQLDPYNGPQSDIDQFHGGPSPKHDILGRPLPRLDGVGAVDGITDLLENKHVICDFVDTLRAVKNGTITPLSPKEYAKVWFPGVLELTSKNLPPDTPLSAKTYSILIALLHRLTIAMSEYHRLMDVRRRTATDEHGVSEQKQRRDAEIRKMAGLEFTPTDNFRRYCLHIHRQAADTQTYAHEYQWVCFMWKQYISCHYKMIHYFWQRPHAPLEWIDTVLLTRPVNNISSIYEEVLPNMRRPIGVGMLPDLACQVGGLGWFRENANKRQTPMMHLWIKVMNKICAVRNWSQILNKYLDTHDGILEIMTMSTLVSALRMYPYAEQCLSIPASMEIWHQLTVEVANIDVHREWVLRHTVLMWFSLREYLFFQLRRNDPLYFVMTRFNNTPAVIESIGRGMDHAARLYDQFGTYIDKKRNIDVMVMLETQYYKEEQLRWPIRVHKKSFLDTLWTEMRSIFDAKFTWNPSYCRQHLPSQETCIRMKKYVDRLDPTATLIFRQIHFVHWGIDEALIAELFACKQSHEISNDADHSTSSRLARILHIPANDFHLLFQFVSYLVDHCSFEPIPLAAQTAEAQEHALRRFLDLEPWQVPTPDQLTSYLCPKCGKICDQQAIPCWAIEAKNTTSAIPTGFDNRSLVNRQRMIPNVRYEHAICSPVCRRSTQVKTGSFQEMLSESHINGGQGKLYHAGGKFTITTQEHDARRLRNHILGKDCSETPLIKIWMIGTAWRIGQALYTVCETCYNIVQLSLDNFGPHGVTCTAHIDDNLAVFRPNSVLFPRAGPIPPSFDASMMSNNLYLVNNGYDWDVIAEVNKTNPSALFSLIKEMEARWLLVRSRSVPIGVDPDTYTGTARPGNAERADKGPVPFDIGVLNTTAKLGYNSDLLALLRDKEATVDFTKALRFCHSCFFCSTVRNKQNRPDDHAWLVFAAHDDNQDSVLIFLCSACKNRIPSSNAKGQIPSYSFENLKAIKEATTNFRAKNRQKFARKNG